MVFERSLSQSGFSGKLLGVGVGAVGLVDYQSGVNRVAPGLGWHDVPLRDALRDRLGVPVTVDNNVRAMTLGEKLIGLARDVADFILIYVGWGVGSGLVIHHELYRGNGFYAGEVGHMMVDPEGLTCVCGNAGCLQTVASGMALVEAARRSADGHPESSLSGLVDRGDFSLETIAEQARLGDPFARSLVSRSAQTMGLAVANLVNVLNPGLVVLAGTLVYSDDYYLSIVDEIVQRRSFVASSAGGTPVVATSLGPLAGVRGAAALALDHYFYSNPSN